MKVEASHSATNGCKTSCKKIHTLPSMIVGQVCKRKIHTLPSMAVEQVCKKGPCVLTELRPD